MYALNNRLERMKEVTSHHLQARRRLPFTVGMCGKGRKKRRDRENKKAVCCWFPKKAPLEARDWEAEKPWNLRGVRICVLHLHIKQRGT